MNQYTIVLCRLCGVKMRRYNMCVYPDDSSCCGKCNEDSGKEGRDGEKSEEEERKSLLGWLDVLEDCIPYPRRRR